MLESYTQYTCSNYHMWPAHDGRRLIVSMAADHRAYKISPADFSDQHHDLVKSLIDSQGLKDFVLTTVGVYGIFDHLKSYFLQFSAIGGSDTRCFYVQPFCRDELGNIFKMIYDIGSFVVTKVSIGTKENSVTATGRNGVVTFNWNGKSRESQNFEMFQFLNAIMLSKQDYPKYTPLDGSHSHGFSKDFTVDIEQLFEQEDAKMKKLQEEIDARQAALNRIRRSRNIGVIAETPRCADGEAVHGRSERYKSPGAGSC